MVTAAKIERVTLSILGPGRRELSRRTFQVDDRPMWCVTSDKNRSGISSKSNVCTYAHPGEGPVSVNNLRLHCYEVYSGSVLESC